MDFPFNYNTSTTFVTSLAEVKQSIYEVLVNFIGTFAQSNKIGSTVSLHTDNSGLLEFGIRDSLAQINNVTYQKCEVDKSDTSVTIRVYVQYNDVDLVIDYSYAN